MITLRISVVALAVVALFASSEALSVKKVNEFRGNGIVFEDQPKTNLLRGAQDLYFDQAILDHFSPAGSEGRRTWKQRYFVNDTFWGGKEFPVFIYIGGEGPLTETAVQGHLFLNDLAQEHKALIVALEHRFYGESYPTEDMSVENLKYLTSQQALADLARFQTWYTKKSGSSGKWISFGGSYPGCLSAWYREKYPHLVYGSIASSAPVRAKLDFSEYMEVVGSALSYFGGDECWNAFDSVVREIAELSYEQIESEFNLCKPIGSKLDLGVFQSTIMETVQGIVQYNLDGGKSGPNVEQMCSFLLNADSPLEAVQHYMKDTTGECFDASYESMVAELKNDKFDGQSAMRQWYYQTCNEFGFYQTTTSSSTPFNHFGGVDLDFFTVVCRDVYDMEGPSIDETNTYYGEDDVETTRILFPNGTIDPWHALGVTDSAQDGLLIEGTAHCADLYAPSEQDSLPLIAARGVVSQKVAKWVEE